MVFGFMFSSVVMQLADWNPRRFRPTEFNTIMLQVDIFSTLMYVPEHHQYGTISSSDALPLSSDAHCRPLDA